MPSWRLAVFAVGCLAFSSAARAGDGVIEINNARTIAGGVTPSDAPGLPVTIDAPGSYLLTGNLQSTGANETIIEIAADDVTLDLNGFAIRCSYFITPCAGTGTGVGIMAATDNVTVRNGIVRDMPSAGIRLGNYATVEKVRSLANGGDGIDVDTSSIVRGSIASDNGLSGIEVGGESRVAHNLSRGNGGDGILAGSNSTLSGNTASNNGFDGIDATGSSTISENTANGNGIFGISTFGGSTIAGNTTNGNTSGGIVTGIGSTVSGNTANGNGGHGIIAAGSVTVQRNMVRGNAGYGLDLATTTAYRENVVSGNITGTVDGGLNMFSNSCNGTTSCP